MILPLLSADMMADFSCAGGLLMVATGLRICNIKMFPVANMLPALVLVMPFSGYGPISLVSACRCPAYAGHCAA